MRHRNQVGQKLKAALGRILQHEEIAAIIESLPSGNPPAPDRADSPATGGSASFLPGCPAGLPQRCVGAVNCDSTMELLAVASTGFGLVSIADPMRAKQ